MHYFCITKLQSSLFQVTDNVRLNPHRFLSTAERGAVWIIMAGLYKL